jgi:putative membrane protein
VKSAAKGFAALAGALHVVFFLFESVLFTRPDVYERFLMGAEQAATVRVWAFNQGFYNLFLALGCFVGLGLLASKPRVGWTLVVYTQAFMIGAGLVLALSEPTLAGASLIQAGPPALALACAWKARTSAASPSASA